MAETHTPYTFLKKLLLFLNGFVAVSGVVLIGLGLGVKYGEAALTRVLGVSSAHFLYFGYLSLGMGCLAVLLSLAMWYGATRQSRGTLLACFLCLVLILIVEVTAASVVLAFFPIVRDVALEHTFLILRRNYRGHNELDDFSAQWNTVMEKLKCCGVNNYTDFSGSSFQVTTGHTYPWGCCKSIGTLTCDGHNVSSDAIHQEGCFVKLLKITKTQTFTLSGVFLEAAAMQVLGIERISLLALAASALYLLSHLTSSLQSDVGGSLAMIPWTDIYLFLQLPGILITLLLFIKLG